MDVSRVQVMYFSHVRLRVLEITCKARGKTTRNNQSKGGDGKLKGDLQSLQVTVLAWKIISILAADALKTLLEDVQKIENKYEEKFEAQLKIFNTSLDERLSSLKIEDKVDDVILKIELKENLKRELE